MRTFRFAAISILLVIVFVNAAFLQETSALAQDNRSVAIETLSPHGTILDTTPTYKWSKVTGATIYRYQVWKGTTLILDKSPDSGVCGATTCEKEPSYTLGTYVYKWRVKYYKAGTWSAWTPYMTFTVSPAGFNNQFNGAMGGWARKSGGTWTINSAKYLYSQGIADHWSSAFKTGKQYTDFDYQVKVWRYGYNTTFIAIRMGGLIFTNDCWYPGYLLGYTNNGVFGVFRLNSDNSTTAIQSWTSTAAIVENKWNILRVVAKGNEFWFYINGVLVKYFTDSAFPRGFVGVQAYRSGGTTQYSIYVDWAELTPIETAQ